MKSQSSAGLDAGYCGGVATPGPDTVVPNAAFRNTKCFRPLSLHSMPLFHICIYHASCCHVCGLREIKICICICTRGVQKVHGQTQQCHYKNNSSVKINALFYSDVKHLYYTVFHFGLKQNPVL